MSMQKQPTITMATTRMRPKLRNTRMDMMPGSLQAIRITAAARKVLVAPP